MRGRAILAAALFVIAGTTSACGGFVMTKDAAHELATRVAAVRAATMSGDRDSAEVALSDLRAAVDRLRESSSLDEGRATEILAVAFEVESALDLMPTTTTTTPELDDDGPGKGHGKGKGGKDDD